MSVADFDGAGFHVLGGKPPALALLIMEGNTLSEGAWGLVRRAAVLRIPILVLADTSRIREEVAQEAGADELLRMPFTSGELDRTITSLVGYGAGSEDHPAEEDLSSGEQPTRSA